MLSIAMTFEVVRPFAAARLRIAAMCRAVMMLVRLAFGLLVGVTIFAIATGLFTSICSPVWVAAPLVYAAGIFCGAALCVPAAALAAPERLAMQALPWISAAAILLPAGTFSRSAATGSWQSSYAIYLAATVCGGIAGTNMALRFLQRRPHPRIFT